MGLGIPPLTIKIMLESNPLKSMSVGSLGVHPIRITRISCTNFWGGIPRPIGDFPESLSQAILVGIILVGRLGVLEFRNGIP